MIELFHKIHGIEPWKIKNTFVRRSHHQKYQESRLQNEKLNAATDNAPSFNNFNSREQTKDTILTVGNSIIINQLASESDTFSGNITGGYAQLP